MAKRILILISCLFCFYLTYSQRKNEYKLRIKKGEVVKVDTQTYWIIPTTLTNLTNDTLTYLSMSCSWQSFYLVSNKKLKKENYWCDKNIPVILKLAPNESREIKLRLIVNRLTNAPPLGFKIGLNLVKIKDLVDGFNYVLTNQQKKMNIIWSN
jgi:hypothetical protein